MYLVVFAVVFYFQGMIFGKAEALIVYRRQERALKFLILKMEINYFGSATMQ